MDSPHIPRVPAPQTYRVAVASHLSSDWLAMPGVVALTMEYDAAGDPTTTLLLEVADRAQLLGVLYEMHDLNLSFLSVELVRPSSPPPTVADPSHKSPKNGIEDCHA